MHTEGEATAIISKLEQAYRGFDFYLSANDMIKIALLDKGKTRFHGTD
jgi:hypothetical protein